MTLPKRGGDYGCSSSARAGNLFATAKKACTHPAEAPIVYHKFRSADEGIARKRKNFRPQACPGSLSRKLPNGMLIYGGEWRI